MGRKLLQERLEGIGYTQKEIEEVMDDLSKLSPELARLRDSWCESGQISDFCCHGENLLGLMEKYQMNYVAALLTMDWIMEEPKEAKRLLEKGIM